MPRLPIPAGHPPRRRDLPVVRQPRDRPVCGSADDHNGNWLRIQGDHPTLVVRHFFYNWETEKASSLQIERVGDQVEPADRSVDLDVMVSRQLYALGDFVHDNLKFFLDFNAGPPINGFMPPIDRTAIGAAA